MITVATFADLQAAIDDFEPEIRIRGEIKAPGQTLNIHQQDGIANQDGVTVIGGGVLRCAGVVADGFRRLKLKELELYAEGVGFTMRNGIMLTIEDYYDCCGGDSMRLESVAGVWASGHVQLTSKAPNQGTTGLKIGKSPQGYESVDMDGVLIEGHFNSVRIGGTGNAVNMWLRNFKCDRPQSTAFMISPSGTAGARNINIISPWINGADYAIAINGAETTGLIERVNIENGEYLGCGHMTGVNPVNVWQGANNVSYNLYGKQIVGPLEPGT